MTQNLQSQCFEQFLCMSYFFSIVHIWIVTVILKYHSATSNLEHILHLNYCSKYMKRTAVAQWLRCWDTDRKVAGSIVAGDIGIFH